MPPEPSHPITPSSDPRVAADNPLAQDASRTTLPCKDLSVDRYRGVRSLSEMISIEFMIGQSTNQEALVCPDVWKFIEDYCPTAVIPVQQLEELGKALVTELGLKLDGDEPIGVEHQQARQESMQGTDAVRKVPGEWFGSGPSASKPGCLDEFAKLSNAIKAWGIKDLQFPNVLRTLAKTTFKSDTFKDDFKIDGCFAKESKIKDAESNCVVEGLATRDVLVAVEYKKRSDSDAVFSNRLKAVSAAVHIMLDDLRRRFLYAVSVEDCWMTVWYFSRDHCVRTTFNWWEDKATMISLFLSFMSATDEDLGMDPHIHLLPSKPHPNLKSRYIYELHQGDKTVYYRTEKSLLEPRSLHITGRTTRVFQVVKVESSSDETEYDDKSRWKVLKDTWMIAESDSESQIQERLFADIDAFVSSSVAQQKERLRGWLMAGGLFHPEIAKYLGEDGRKPAEDFRELFLCIDSQSIGPPVRAIHKEYLQEADTFYESDPTRAMMHGQYRPSLRIPLHRRNTFQSASRLLRRHPAKKRTFIVFNDLCRPVYNLPDVGSVFNVLSNTVIALALMFAGDWVHRDISTGNVMALFNHNTSQWESKLGDLEYARRVAKQGESTEPKTGTAYFMATEMLSDEYLISRSSFQNSDFENYFPSEVGASLNLEPEPESDFDRNHIVHDFYHDLEPVHWIGLWTVACRVGHQPSQQHVAPIFSLEISRNINKEKALTDPISQAFTDSLLPALRPTVPLLDNFRLHLWRNVRYRATSSCTPELRVKSYAYLYPSAYRILRELAARESSWYQIPLQGVDCPHFVPGPPQAGAADVAASLFVRASASASTPPSASTRRPSASTPSDTGVGQSRGLKRDRGEGQISEGELEDRPPKMSKTIGLPPAPGAA